MKYKNQKVFNDDKIIDLQLETGPSPSSIVTNSMSLRQLDKITKFKNKKMVYNPNLEIQ